MFFRLKRFILALLACATPAQAFDIQFDYTYDTGNFFSGANVNRRLTLEAAATIFEDELTLASLSAIVPSGGNTWSLILDNPTTGGLLELDNLTIAADTLTIFIGARNLGGSTVGLASSPGYSAGGSGAWLDLFSSKNTNDHYEPFGGSISFDTGTAWYFDPDPLTLENFPGQIDLFSVAQHEIGHLLGFTDSSDAFFNLTTTGSFTGLNATTLFGSSIPLSVDFSHFQNGVTYQGNELTMAPALLANTRTVFSELEFAVLRDIGFGANLGTLNVTINDPAAGSVTSGFLGQSARQIGTALTLRATPKSGFMFLNWSGSINSSANPLQFAMVDGLSLQANFVPLPYIAGKFYGTFQNGSTPETNGYWQFTVTRLGSITGVLVLNGRRIVIRGTIDLTGHWDKVFVAGPDSAALSLDQNFGTGALTGTLTINAVAAQFAGNPLPVYTLLVPCPLKGSYTLALLQEAVAPVPQPPQGSGYARVVITTKGRAKFTGKLADGSAMLFSVPLSDNNTIAVSRLLARKQESLRGTMVFPATDVANDFDGSLLWTRLPNPGSEPRPWNDGFTTTLSAIGSRWVKPLPTFRVLTGLDTTGGAANIDLTLSGLLVVTSVNVSSGNIILENPVSANLLRMSVTPRTGLFRGSYLDTNTVPNVRRSFAGVFLQKQNRAEGYVSKLVTPRESGRLRLSL